MITSEKEIADDVSKRIEYAVCYADPDEYSDEWGSGSVEGPFKQEQFR